MSAFLFVAMAILWGSSAIVTGHQAISGAPEVSVGYRTALVSLVMFGWSIARGKTIGLRPIDQPWVVVQGILFFGLAFITFYHSTTLITSGISALILSTSSLFAAVVGWLFLSAPVTMRMLFGIISGIALGSSQVVPVHSMLGLDVANHRFDRRSTPHLALDGRRHAVFLAGGEDPEAATVGRVVAAISGIGENAADLVADLVAYGLLHVGNDGRKGMAVIGVARQRHGMQGKLAALRALQRGGTVRAARESQNRIARKQSASRPNPAISESLPMAVSSKYQWFADSSRVTRHCPDSEARSICFLEVTIVRRQKRWAAPMIFPLRLPGLLARRIKASVLHGPTVHLFKRVLE